MTAIDEDQRQQIIDDEHLKLLRIGYFISAGTTALASLFILMYTFFAFFILAQVAEQGGQAAPPAFIGRIVGVFGLGLSLAMITVAVLQVVTGQRLKQRRSRVFCMIMAGVTCLHIPYGTLLGVCTFVVLSRPGVQRSFQKLPG